MSMDSSMHFVRKKWYYDQGQLLSGLTTAPLTAGAGSEAETVGQGIENAATAAATGSQEYKKGLISTLGYSGIQTNVTTTGGASINDKLAFLLRLPYDINPYFPIGVRVNHSASAAAGANVSVLWVPTYKTVKKGVALTTIASVSTALDTTIAAKLNTAANANEWTSRGIIKNIGLTKEEVEDGALLQFKLNATWGATTPGVVTLLGIEIDYAVWACEGPGSLVDQAIRANSNAVL